MNIIQKREEDDSKWLEVHIATSEKSDLVFVSDEEAKAFLVICEKVGNDFILSEDSTTPSGRKDIVKNARRFASLKCSLDRLAKSKTGEWRTKIKIANRTRGILYNGLQEIQDNVRQSVTDLENIEKRKVEVAKEIEDLLGTVSRLASPIDNVGNYWSTPMLKKAISALTELTQNKHEPVRDAARAGVKTVEMFIKDEKQRADDAEELAALRKEKDQREYQKSMREAEERGRQKAREEIEAEKDGAIALKCAEASKIVDHSQYNAWNEKVYQQKNWEGVRSSVIGFLAGLNPVEIADAIFAGEIPHIIFKMGANK